MEIGCGSGALARECRKRFPIAEYLGVEINPEYAALAARYCNRTLVVDIEAAGDDFWEAHADRDCWIFADVLEHLRDPWLILRRIRAILPAKGVVVACIPNIQHWSVQVNLLLGNFRYEDIGLLDRTHLRWFTRKTIIEMFETTGYVIQQGAPRIFEEPNRAKFLPAIEQMARLVGADPQRAIADCLPLQYVIRAGMR
jgi:tRNA A58 N-methylase Trm61